MGGYGTVCVCLNGKIEPREFGMLVKRAGSVLLLPKAVLLIRNRRIRVKGSASLDTDPHHWKRIRITGYEFASVETDPYHWKRISLSGLAKDFVLQGRSITSQSEPVFLKCPRIG